MDNVILLWFDSRWYVIFEIDGARQVEPASIIEDNETMCEFYHNGKRYQKQYVFMPENIVLRTAYSNLCGRTPLLWEELIEPCLNVNNECIEQA